MIRISSNAFQGLLRTCVASSTFLILVPSTTSCSAGTTNEESDRFLQILEAQKSKLSTYKSRWDWNNKNSRIPTNSWPSNLPDASALESLNYDLKFCVRSPNYRASSSYCHDLQFRIGYALIQSGDAKGLKMLLDMAEVGHADSMCAYGICLMDGLASLESNPILAISWFRRCSEMYEHKQAMYELGVALFTGEGVVENEVEAVKYFKKAAEKGHAGAAFMYGDCLLDGVGIARDRGCALEWLIRAGEMGHRGARSRVLAVLEKQAGKDYGMFTDGSNQTLKAAVRSNSEDKLHEELEDEMEINERLLEERLQWQLKPNPLERKYTNGGSSPKIITRRMSKVNESREV